MSYEFTRNAHSVSCLNYHLVQCIKYRRKVFDNDDIIDELKSRTYNIADRYGISIDAMETDIDHVHILFTATPSTDLSLFINNWKSATSKAISNRFREQLSEKLWNGVFWSTSYCLITTGQTTLDRIRKYVEEQGIEKNDEIQATTEQTSG